MQRKKIQQPGWKRKISKLKLKGVSLSKAVSLYRESPKKHARH